MSFREEFEALEAGFAEAFKRGDAAASAAFYTEDAVYVACGIAPVRGRAAIQALFEETMEAGYELKSLSATEMGGDTNLGYAVETIVSSEGVGTVMLVLRRDEQGAWRICAEAEIPT